MLADAPSLLILAGAVAAGFVQGLSGFAVGLVATAFWTHEIAPQVIAPLIVLCSTAGQALTIRSVLPSLDWRRAGPMVAGGVAGVPLGVALLPLVDTAVFQFSVGLLLSVYCPAMLMLRRLPTVTFGGSWADAAAGAVGGVMGGLAGLAGPAPTLWCALRGWHRDAQRAVFQTFLLVAQGVALTGFLLTGAFTPQVVRLSLWILPFVLLPSFLGMALYPRISALGFRRLILGLLFVTGLALLAQSVPGLVGRVVG